MNPKKKVRDIRNKIVRIESYDERGGLLSLGCGFIIHKDGLIGTSFSVVGRIADGEAAYHPRIVVRFIDDRTVMASVSPNPRAESSRVHWVGNTAYNYEILKIDMKNLPFFDLGEYETAEIGDEIYFGGYPFGKMEQTLHRGIISCKFTDYVKLPDTEKRFHRNVFYIDGIGSSGHTGAPVINSFLDKVIGIIDYSLNPITSKIHHIKEESRISEPGEQKQDEKEKEAMKTNMSGVLRSFIDILDKINIAPTGAISIEYLKQDLLSR